MLPAWATSEAKDYQFNPPIHIPAFWSLTRLDEKDSSGILRLEVNNRDAILIVSREMRELSHPCYSS